jgi:AraC-like DNA-binding protein
VNQTRLTIILNSLLKLIRSNRLAAIKHTGEGGFDVDLATFCCPIQQLIGHFFDLWLLLVEERTAMDHLSLSPIEANAKADVKAGMAHPDSNSPLRADASSEQSYHFLAPGNNESAAVLVNFKELDTFISVVANRARNRRSLEATISSHKMQTEELPPGVRTSICFRIDRSRVARYRQYVQGIRNEIADSNSPHLTDPVVKRLTAALTLASERGSEFDGLYAEAVRLAIVTRILSLQNVAESTLSRQGAPLQKWRLKRALDYIKTHYSDTIRLKDLAKAAGLSRMHFAAQFRMATGVRPREFIVQYRIEMSRRLLAETNDSVVEIALAVGFQSQSHFTTVFRQCVGETPSRWRSLCLDSREATSLDDTHTHHAVAA